MKRIRPSQATMVRSRAAAGSRGARGRDAEASRSWVRVGFGLGVGLLMAYALGQALLQSAQILTLVLLALFAAVSLDPVVAALQRVRVPRGLAVVVVVLSVAALAALFVALVIPPVSREIDQLTKQIPIWLQDLHNHNSALGRIEDRYHVVEKVKQQLASGGLGAKLASGVLGAGKILLGLLTGAVIVITLTIYFMIGLPSIEDFGLRMVAASRRARTRDLTDQIMRQVGRFMLANLATSAIAGLATSAWCWALGIPYGALLGFFVAIMDLIPIIGSTIGGVVVSLVALSVSLPAAIATALFYTGFRFLEDHLTTPLTMKYVVRLHPVATLIAVLIGGTLLGIVGALVAVPAAAAVGLVLDEVVFPARDRA
ncbi:putative PurR-regulated permease PerM [Catenulispora sp. MAP5-51]|uniref:AI-2E family transporter n=1 Tax=Catenulispora sp. MAP5-51 TaxID=3156298 RepID=UPI003510D4AD